MTDFSLWILELGRFHNSSVPVLNFKQHSVPVLIGSIWNWTFGSGSAQFGSSVLTILIFWPKSAQILQNWILYTDFQKNIHFYHLDFYLKMIWLWKNCAVLANINNFSLKFVQNCIFSWENSHFRLPAVLKFGSGSLRFFRNGKISVPVPYRFQKMGSKPPVPRFRLEPTQLYWLLHMIKMVRHC